MRAHEPQVQHKNEHGLLHHFFENRRNQVLGLCVPSVHVMICQLVVPALVWEVATPPQTKKLKVLSPARSSAAEVYEVFQTFRAGWAKLEMYPAEITEPVLKKQVPHTTKSTGQIERLLHKLALHPSRSGLEPKVH